MKKLFSFFFFVVFLLFLVGCSSSSNLPETTPSSTSITAAPVSTPTPSPSAEELYATAKTTLYKCDFESALNQFESLGDFEDSVEFTDYCRYRIEKEKEPVNVKYTLESNISETKFKGGTLYFYSFCYIYVPNQCDENTRSMVYFAGGTGENLLYLPGVYKYFENYSPNAVMLFFCESGYTHMKGIAQDAVDIMRQLELECHFVIHDFVLIGSSNGAYTAIRSAALMYEYGGIKAKSVLSMDAGDEWNLPSHITDENLAVIADIKTTVYLFEQDNGVWLKYDFIKHMVDSGVDVRVVECREDGHNRISVNLYKYGLFSWAFEEYSDLMPEEYTEFKPTFEDFISTN